MNRRLSLLTAVSILVLSTVFASGCASATSTEEIPLDRAPDSRSVGATKANTNVNLRAEDPLQRITREPTGTIVGARVDELLAETVKLRESIAGREQEVQDVRGIGAASAIQYHSAVGAIEARLQQGTTPGNPILLRQWDEAQAYLDQMSTSVSRLNTLSTDVSSDASMAGYLLGSIKAALELSGAVDEDHDHLKMLRDVVSQNIVQVERMKTEVASDLMRLNNYMTTERNNLQTLAFAIEKGEYLGNNLSSRPLVLTPTPVSTLSGQSVSVNGGYQPVQIVPSAAAATMPVASPAIAVDSMDTSARSGVGLGTAINEGSAAPAPASYDPMTQNLSSLPDESDSKTLAIIRFNQQNVPFEKQLYTAVSETLDQSPNSLFTVVAVTPEAGNAANVAAGTAEAQRRADEVKRSLIQMGLPPSRIAMSAVGDRAANSPEVRVLVR